jgi:hypothetical protein
MIVNYVHKKINGITRDVQRYEKLPMAEQADWARGQTVTTQTIFLKVDYFMEALTIVIFCALLADATL